MEDVEVSKPMKTLQSNPSHNFSRNNHEIIHHHNNDNIKNRSNIINNSLKSDLLAGGCRSSCSLHVASLCHHPLNIKGDDSNDRCFDYEDASGKIKRYGSNNGTLLSNSIGFPKKDYSHNPYHFRKKRRHHDLPYIYEPLPLEYWDRSDDCREAKVKHMDRIDEMFQKDRESVILHTTLWKEDTVLERNMFPYETPVGIEHYTLWSIHDLNHEQICSFVEDWLSRYFPQVRRWEYDDNSGDRSIELFHVHVFFETIPFSYIPTDLSKIYQPTHAMYKS